MRPVDPNALGEWMDHTVMQWGPNMEFDPRTMLTPPEYARWIAKYAKLVRLSINNRRYGEPRFGTWGYPSEELQTRLEIPGAPIPCPYPQGNLNLKKNILINKNYL